MISLEWSNGALAERAPTSQCRGLVGWCFWQQRSCCSIAHVQQGSDRLWGQQQMYGWEQMAEFGGGCQGRSSMYGVVSF